MPNGVINIFNFPSYISKIEKPEFSFMIILACYRLLLVSYDMLPRPAIAHYLRPVGNLLLNQLFMGSPMWLNQHAVYMCDGYGFLGLSRGFNQAAITQVTT